MADQFFGSDAELGAYERSHVDHVGTYIYRSAVLKDECEVVLLAYSLDSIYHLLLDGSEKLLLLTLKILGGVVAELLDILRHGLHIVSVEIGRASCRERV